MSATLHLCNRDDLERLEKLVRAFHEEFDLDLSDDHRHAALLPLVEGSPHGAAYLMGPRQAPIGYVVVSFGWAIELGGLDGFIDEIYVRPAVRGRGIASAALLSLSKSLASAGVKGLHMEVDRNDKAAQRLYQRCGFELRDRYALMSRYF